jgi:pimeloyl-ACP methyl ester carboxylesterase
VVAAVSVLERRVRAGDVEIATREWEGDGRPFVLVHGLASNARTWDLVAAAFNRAGHRVIAVDQRGHGQSDKPEKGYGFEEVTADLAALIEALGLEKPIVAGQSWGGNVTVDFASRYPDMLTGLVLVDGGLIALAQRPGATWERIAVDLKPPNLLGMPREELIARILVDQPGWSEEQLALQMGNYETLEDGTIRPWLSLEHHMEILWALWNQDATRLVDELETPTLMALADSGPPERRVMRVEQAERLEAARPDTVRWRQFEGAAHDIHIDQPDALADWVLAAIAEGFFG